VTIDFNWFVFSPNKQAAAIAAALQGSKPCNSEPCLLQRSVHARRPGLQAMLNKVR
jgi:hypothetical protein